MYVLTTPPVGSTGSTQEVELEGVFCNLTLRWNDRASSWMLDLADEDEVNLATGIPLRAGVPLTYYLRHRSGMPPGTLMALDTSDELGDPGFEELGTRVKLVYLEASELAELGQ